MKGFLVGVAVVLIGWWVFFSPGSKFQEQPPTVYVSCVGQSYLDNMAACDEAGEP